MTPWLVVAAVLAVADWLAVGFERPVIERTLKPLVMLALIAAAISGDGGQVGFWILGGLVLSLAGDVFLMLPKEQFIAGLASFLLAHVAYSVGFLGVFESQAWLLASLILLIPAVVFVARPIVAAVSGRGSSVLTWAVAAYMTAISVMVALAFGTAVEVAMRGAVLFFASDAILGWNKFIKPIRNGRVVLMVCYHLGQGLIVASIPLLS